MYTSFRIGTAASDFICILAIVCITLLKLSHFRRHNRKTTKRTPGKSTTYPFHKPEEHDPPGQDTTKKISNLIGKATKYAGSAKSKKPVPYVPTITNYTQLWWVPNVVVAHQKEGIETIHLASGRTLCKVKNLNCAPSSVLLNDKVILELEHFNSTTLNGSILLAHTLNCAHLLPLKTLENVEM